MQRKCVGKRNVEREKVNAFYRSLVTMLVSLNRRSDLGMGNVDVLYRPPLLCYFVCIGNRSSASPETPRPADANIWVCHNSRRGWALARQPALPGVAPWRNDPGIPGAPHGQGLHESTSTPTTVAQRQPTFQSRDRPCRDKNKSFRPVKMESSGEFPCSMYAIPQKTLGSSHPCINPAWRRRIDIPLPTNRLATTALKAIEVDLELSPLVRRELSVVAPSDSSVPEGAALLRADYRATTNRMLRVSTNGFMESLRLVLEVMETLDTDVLEGQLESGRIEAQAIENTGG